MAVLTPTPTVQGGVSRTPIVGDSPSIIDLASFVLTIVGILTLAQQIHGFVYSFLPAQEMKESDKILANAAELYYIYVDEGLLVEGAYGTTVERRLIEFSRRSDKLRVKVHCASSFLEQWSLMWAGTSKQIRKLRAEIEITRAELSTRADIERTELHREGKLPRLTIVPQDVYTTSRVLYAPQSISRRSGASQPLASGHAMTTTALRGPPATLVPRGPAYPRVISDYAGPPPAPGTCTGSMTCPMYDPVRGSCGHEYLRDATTRLGDTLRSSSLFEDLQIPSTNGNARDLDSLVEILKALTLRVSEVAAAEVQRASEASRGREEEVSSSPNNPPAARTFITPSDERPKTE